MRRPVRLVGSANVATSFGSGMFGSGRATVSKMTIAPGPAGVGRKPDGMESIEHATSAKKTKRYCMTALYFGTTMGGMKTRAAVAWEVGKPLVVEDVDLE